MIGRLLFGSVGRELERGAQRTFARTHVFPDELSLASPTQREAMSELAEPLRRVLERTHRRRGWRRFSRARDRDVTMDADGALHGDQRVEWGARLVDAPLTHASIPLAIFGSLEGGRRALEARAEREERDRVTAGESARARRLARALRELGIREDVTEREYGAATAELRRLIEDLRYRDSEPGYASPSLGRAMYQDEWDD